MSFLRPVILVGALNDLIAERLVQDFPYQFGRVCLEAMHCSGPMLEKGLAENIFVDYKRRGSHYECVTMAAIKEVSSKVTTTQFNLYSVMVLLITNILHRNCTVSWTSALLEWSDFKEPKCIPSFFS